MALLFAACGDEDGFAGTWRSVDEQGREARLEIVETDDCWKASQGDLIVLPWDANVFQREGARLVSFGDDRPEFEATIDLQGDVLTVYASNGTFVYERQ